MEQSAFRETKEVLSWSRNFPLFMEPGLSLRHSQPPEPDICLYSDRDQLNPRVPFHFLKSILILFSHLLLVLLRKLFHSGFLTKTLYTSLLSPIRAKCSAHLILLDLITRITFGEEYRSWSSSLCSSLHPAVVSSLLGPNIILSTLFSSILSLCSSLNLRDQVSNSYYLLEKLRIFRRPAYGFHLCLSGCGKYLPNPWACAIYMEYVNCVE